MRPARDSDMTDQAEDWIIQAEESSLTANKPTTVISNKVDTNEIFVVEWIGTNAGWDCELQLKNKNDTIGEAIKGSLAPLGPKIDRYYLKPAILFEAGDHINLVATVGTATTTERKFAIGGWKIDKSRT